MPTYCYEDQDGQVIERWFRMGEAPQEIKLDGGAVANRSYRAERPNVPCEKGWPLECIASGVHPDQAQELRDHLRGRGVPTEVSRDGNPIYRNAQHRKRALKARGLYDRNSFC
jgi:hypothetical protein